MPKLKGMNIFFLVFESAEKYSYSNREYNGQTNKVSLKKYVLDDFEPWKRPSVAGQQLIYLKKKIYETSLFDMTISAWMDIQLFRK